jgi:hypothetical protein
MRRTITAAIVALGLVALAAPVGAAPIVFYTGDGSIVLASSVNPGAITTINPHPAWGDVNTAAGLPLGTADWISYANTGFSVPPNVLAPNVVSRTRANATAVFSRPFTGGGTFKLWILTDDTSAVDLVNLDNALLTQTLFEPFPTQVDPCAPGNTGVPIGCVNSAMGVVTTQIPFGNWDLRVYAMQTNNDVFGTQFAASVPEPATMGLFGLAVFGLSGAVRRRLNG